MVTISCAAVFRHVGRWGDIERGGLVVGDVALRRRSSDRVVAAELIVNVTDSVPSRSMSLVGVTVTVPDAAFCSNGHGAAEGRDAPPDVAVPMV